MFPPADAKPLCGAPPIPNVPAVKPPPVAAFAPPCPPLPRDPPPPPLWQLPQVDPVPPPPPPAAKSGPPRITKPLAERLMEPALPPFPPLPFQLLPAPPPPDVLISPPTVNPPAVLV